MLLPTYDVFDEMRNFAPAREPALFPFCGKQMALTICEDAWNDKQFWNKRLYTFDPVEALMHAGREFSAQHFRLAFLAGEAGNPPRDAGHHRAPLIACRW